MSAQHRTRKASWMSARRSSNRDSVYVPVHVPSLKLSLYIWVDSLEHPVFAK